MGTAKRSYKNYIMDLRYEGAKLFLLSITCRMVWYNITVTSYWAWWRLESPASRLFTQTFVQAQIKQNINVPRHWLLLEQFIGDRWNPRTKVVTGEFHAQRTSNGENAFYLMTPPWYKRYGYNIRMIQCMISNYLSLLSQTGLFYCPLLGLC